MKKGIIKTITFLIFTAMLLFSINNFVYAASGSNLVKQYNGTVTENNVVDTVSKLAGPVLRAVRVAAVGISIIMINYLGIKYMSAAPTEKANIKNQLVTFVVGAVIVFGAPQILTIAKDTAKKIEGK